MASDYCSLHGASACEKLILQDNKQEQGRRNCGWRGSNIPLQIPPKSLRLLIDPLQGPPHIFRPSSGTEDLLSVYLIHYVFYLRGILPFFVCKKVQTHKKEVQISCLARNWKLFFNIYEKNVFVSSDRYVFQIILTMDAGSWKKLWIFYLLHSNFFCKLFSSKMIWIFYYSTFSI